MIKILHVQNEFIFFLLEKFLLPYEKFCCTLMYKILTKEKSIYFLCDEKFPSSILQPYFIEENNLIDSTKIEELLHSIHGIISFENNRTVFHCLPEQSKEIFKALKFLFFKQIISGIVGEKKSTEYLQKIIKKANCGKEKEIREYFFMETEDHLNQNVKIHEEGNYKEKILLCSEKDTNSLMPLQLFYLKEEVTPESRTTNAAVERLLFEKLVKKNLVYGIKNGNDFVAKAQISVCTNNFLQIGGVYTLKEFRKQGKACSLVTKIVNRAELENKKAVLFVKKKNLSAIHSYEKAGFVIIGEYRIVYY